MQEAARPALQSGAPSERLFRHLVADGDTLLVSDHHQRRFQDYRSRFLARNRIFQFRVRAVPGGAALTTLLRVSPDSESGRLLSVNEFDH